MAKSYKGNKRGRSGRHIQLTEWVQALPAWATMKPGPRALYIELLRRYNGYNNGKIFLSHREAAKAINVGRDTVAGYFRILENRGFIIKTQGHCLGPSGVGQAATYRLTQHPCDGQAATKEFAKWK